METLDLNAYRLNPDLAGILHLRARRARAQAVHNGMLGLLRAIKQRVAAHGVPRLPLAARWG
jgi:hypothetical protein